jgi:hypothetical protein
MEQQLMALARATVYPPTPDLAAGFWRHLDAERTRKAHANPFSLAAVGTAAAVVAFALLIGIVAPARDAAADLFDTINIFETNEPLKDFPTGIIGEEVTLTEAQVALGREILQPTYPEGAELERVILQDFGSVKAVALFYTARDERFVLFATNSRVGKGLPENGDSTREPLAIPEKDVGFWLTGEHLVQLFDQDGQVVTASERVTDANTLIWPEGDFVYKIEGDVTQKEAIAIAASVE